MPRYVPQGQSLTEEIDSDFQREWQAELDLAANRDTF